MPAVGVPRIAVLEDDPSQAKLVSTWITSQNFVCRLFERGADLLDSALRDTFDLIVLDWQVPDLNGDEVLRAMRKSARAHVPVLFTTGRSREEDIVHALRSGADDYLVKPLRKEEFIARIEALLRRSRRGGQEDSIFEIGPFRIDAQGRTLHKNGVALELTQKEFDVASILLRNVGRLLSRSYLLDTVWGVGIDVRKRTVDTHVSQVRGKLGLYPEEDWRLSAVYQHGYRLDRVSQPAPESASSRAPRRSAKRKRN